jgi:hypothetical protein
MIKDNWPLILILAVILGIAVFGCITDHERAVIERDWRAAERQAALDMTKARTEWYKSTPRKKTQ